MRGEGGAPAGRRGRSLLHPLLRRSARLPAVAAEAKGQRRRQRQARSNQLAVGSMAHLSAVYPAYSLGVRGSTFVEEPGDGKVRGKGHAATQSTGHCGSTKTHLLVAQALPEGSCAARGLSECRQAYVYVRSVKIYQRATGQRLASDRGPRRTAAALAAVRVAGARRHRASST